MTLSTEKVFDWEQGKTFLTRLLRKIFLEDWVMKLVALIITLGLWLGITGLRKPVSSRFGSVPLNLRVANDLEVTNSSSVTEVEVKVLGDKSKVDQINKENLLVTLDLSDLQPGDRRVTITPDNVSVELPAGVKLESISPSIISVKMERVIERDVPVKAQTEGVVEEGYEIYEDLTRTNPPTVRVSGPESFVRPLDSISTEKISVEAKQADFVAQQVSLSIVNPKVRLVDTTVVDVVFRIGEKRIERPFIMALKTEKGERRVSFKLYGARSLVDAIQPETLHVESSKSETGENSFNVILPPELEKKVEIRDRKMPNR